MQSILKKKKKSFLIQKCNPLKVLCLFYTQTHVMIKQVCCAMFDSVRCCFFILLKGFTHVSVFGNVKRVIFKNMICMYVHSKYGTCRLFENKFNKSFKVFFYLSWGICGCLKIFLMFYLPETATFM